LTYISDEVGVTERGLAYYEVKVNFLEEATVTLVAPSEAAAVTLVIDQYRETLGELAIINVRYLEPISNAEGTSIQ